MRTLKANSKPVKPFHSPALLKLAVIMALIVVMVLVLGFMEGGI
jgi:hypothetical protein